MDYKLDNVDKSILKLLQQNAQIPYTEIAKKINTSAGTVHVRMKKLLEYGFVEGSTVKLNYKKLGYNLVAFVGIYLEKNSFFDAVNEELLRIAQVVSCHYITGNYSMFLKIVCRHPTDLKDILHDHIQPIEGIARTETFISLNESIERPLPLLNSNKIG